MTLLQDRLAAHFLPKKSGGAVATACTSPPEKVVKLAELMKAQGAREDGAKGGLRRAMGRLHPEDAFWHVRSIGEGGGQLSVGTFLFRHRPVLRQNAYSTQTTHMHKCTLHTPLDP